MRPEMWQYLARAKGNAVRGLARVGAIRLIFVYCVLLAAILPSGCLRCFHPLPPDAQLEADLGPQPGRQNVHVFIVHGLDPCDFANLEGIRDHLKQIGYCDCRLFQFFDCPKIEAEIRGCKEQYPNEPIALVGFSFGCLAARRVANELHDESGLCIDLLFYMGGWFMRDETTARPPFVPRVVNVLGSGCDRAGLPLPDAENIRVNNLHFGTPTNPAVFQRLEHELDMLASCDARLGKPSCR